MASFGIVHGFPGGTKEQYDASISHVHASDGSLPRGTDLPRGRAHG